LYNKPSRLYWNYKLWVDHLSWFVSVISKLSSTVWSKLSSAISSNPGFTCEWSSLMLSVLVGQHLEQQLQREQMRESYGSRDLIGRGSHFQLFNFSGKRLLNRVFLKEKFLSYRKFLRTWVHWWFQRRLKQPAKW